MNISKDIVLFNKYNVLFSNCIISTLNKLKIVGYLDNNSMQIILYVNYKYNYKDIDIIIPSRFSNILVYFGL